MGGRAWYHLPKANLYAALLNTYPAYRSRYGIIRESPVLRQFLATIQEGASEKLCPISRGKYL